MYRFGTIIGILTIFLICATSCKVTNSGIVKEKDQPVLQLLTKQDASRFLTTRDKDGYYQALTPIHMAVQLQDNSLLNATDPLTTYLSIIKNHTDDFTPEGQSVIAYVIPEAVRLLHNINDSLLPDTLVAIQVEDQHYGAEVFYTMDNAIIYPQSVLKAPVDTTALIDVTLHELAHIISRYQPSLKDSLYKLIGFERHQRSLIIEDGLRERILTNPDGVAMDHAFRLKAVGYPDVLALPLVVSTQQQVRSDMPRFFDYIYFDLYALDPQGDGTAKVLYSPDRTTTIDPVYMQSFFEGIADNTTYIIHPDEIIADNIKLAIRYAASDIDSTYFSASGLRLVEDVTATMEQFGR